MIIGKYSLKNIYGRYNDPNERELLREEWAMLILYFVIWVTALLLLILYWSQLELWARVVGILGLLTFSEGPLITLVVIWLGKTIYVEPEILKMPELTRSEDD